MTNDKYKSIVEIASTGDKEAKMKIAKNTITPPEILYFLAKDESKVVRRAVAKNKSTPLHASDILVKDKDEKVREILAKKLSKSIPTPENSLYSIALKSMEHLANDAMVLVRAMLAEELKKMDDAPYSIIKKLAYDKDEKVSGAILQYSPILTNNDLVSVVKSKPKTYALSSIAKRENLAEIVSDEIVDNGNSVAISHMMKNKTANISQESFIKATKLGINSHSLQKNIVLHPKLEPQTIGSIYSFLAIKVIDELQAEGLSDEIAMALAQKVDSNILSSEAETRAMSSDIYKMAQEKHKINDEITMKYIQSGDSVALSKAFSVLLSIDSLKIKDIITSANCYNQIMAICWYCGLSADAGFSLQMLIAKVNESDLVLPTNNGGYSIKVSTMKVIIKNMKLK